MPVPHPRHAPASRTLAAATAFVLAVAPLEGCKPKKATSQAAQAPVAPEDRTGYVTWTLNIKSTKDTPEEHNLQCWYYYENTLSWFRDNPAPNKHALFLHLVQTEPQKIRYVNLRALTAGVIATEVERLGGAVGEAYLANQHDPAAKQLVDKEELISNEILVRAIDSLDKQGAGAQTFDCLEPLAIAQGMVVAHQKDPRHSRVRIINSNTMLKDGRELSTVAAGGATFSLWGSSVANFLCKGFCDDLGRVFSAASVKTFGGKVMGRITGALRGAAGKGSVEVAEQATNKAAANAVNKTGKELSEKVVEVGVKGTQKTAKAVGGEVTEAAAREAAEKAAADASKKAAGAAASKAGQGSTDKTAQEFTERVVGATGPTAPPKPPNFQADPGLTPMSVGNRVAGMRPKPGGLNDPLLNSKFANLDEALNKWNELELGKFRTGNVASRKRFDVEIEKLKIQNLVDDLEASRHMARIFGPDPVPHKNLFTSLLSKVKGLVTGRNPAAAPDLTQQQGGNIVDKVRGFLRSKVPRPPGPRNAQTLDDVVELGDNLDKAQPPPSLGKRAFSWGKKATGFVAAMIVLPPVFQTVAPQIFGDGSGVGPATGVGAGRAEATFTATDDVPWASAEQAIGEATNPLPATDETIKAGLATAAQSIGKQLDLVLNNGTRVEREQLACALGKSMEMCWTVAICVASLPTTAQFEPCAERECNDPAFTEGVTPPACQ